MGGSCKCMCIIPPTTSLSTSSKVSSSSPYDPYIDFSSIRL